MAHPLNHTFFDTIDSQDKAYWLGFLTADGSIGNSSRGDSIELTLQIADIDHLKKFLKAINRDVEPRVYKTNKDTSCCRVIFNSRRMVASLNKLGLLSDKTTSATLASIDESLKAHYWRGLIDGDGSLQIRSPGGYKALRIMFCGTQSIVESFAEYVKDITGTQVKIALNGKVTTVNYATSVNSGSALTLAKDIYNNANVYLERKYRIYQEALETTCALHLEANPLDEYLKANNLGLTQFAKLHKFHIANLWMIHRKQRRTSAILLKRISEVTDIPYLALVSKE